MGTTGKNCEKRAVQKSPIDTILQGQHQKVNRENPGQHTVSTCPEMGN